MAGPLIYYSLMTGGPRDADYLSQLKQSLTSLRRVNRELPVQIYLSGPIGTMIAMFLQQEFGVTLIECGSYAAQLDALLPGSSAVLGRYPILHKFLAMAQLPEATQVLYVDSDTWFFADPAPLFSACREVDIYARPEPRSPDSPLGPDPTVIDAAALQALAAAEGAHYVKPFNTGAMLLNHKVWQRFSPHLPRYLAYCLRFTAAVRPEAPLPPAIAQLGPLPYPAGNLWIRDQVAFWLCLGQLPDVSLEFLKASQLSLGCEPYADRLEAALAPASPIISHYFSKNFHNFMTLLRHRLPFKYH